MLRPAWIQVTTPEPRLLSFPTVLWAQDTKPELRGVLVGLILGELFLSILRGILGPFYLDLLGTST